MIAAGISKQPSPYCHAHAYRPCHLCCVLAFLLAGLLQAPAQSPSNPVLTYRNISKCSALPARSMTPCCRRSDAGPLQYWLRIPLTGSRAAQPMGHVATEGWESRRDKPARGTCCRGSQLLENLLCRHDTCHRAGAIKSTAPFFPINWPKTRPPPCDVGVAYQAWAHMCPSIAEFIKTYRQKGVKEFIIVGRSRSGPVLSALMVMAALPVPAYLIAQRSYCCRRQPNGSAAPKPGNMQYVYDTILLHCIGWELYRGQCPRLGALKPLFFFFPACSLRTSTRPTPLWM